MKEGLTRIEKEKFDLALMKYIQMLLDQIADLKSIPDQIQYYEGEGYRIEYYMEEDGSTTFVPVKKEIGFKVK